MPKLSANSCAAARAASVTAIPTLPETQAGERSGRFSTMSAQESSSRAVGFLESHRTSMGLVGEARLPHHAAAADDRADRLAGELHPRKRRPAAARGEPFVLDFP